MDMQGMDKKEWTAEDERQSVLFSKIIYVTISGSMSTSVLFAILFFFAHEAAYLVISLDALILSMSLLVSLVLNRRKMPTSSRIIYLASLCITIFVAVCMSGGMPAPVTPVLIVVAFASGLIGRRFELPATCLLIATFTLASTLLTQLGIIDLDTDIFAENMGLVSGVFYLILYVMAFGVTKLFVDINKRALASANERLETIQSMISVLTALGHRLTNSTDEILATVRQHQQSARQLAVAVNQVKETLANSLKLSHEVSSSAQDVFANAEITSESNKQATEELTTLVNNTAHITSIAEEIHELSNKADLLALNAALEGVRVTSGGEGFLLVANQMQKLAETSMVLLRKIKDTTREIILSSESTSQSMEKATTLSYLTTDKGRQIAGFALQQQSGTEEINKTMDSIQEDSTNVALATNQTLSSIGEIRDIIEELSSLLGNLTSASTATGSRPPDDEGRRPGNSGSDGSERAALGA